MVDKKYHIHINAEEGSISSRVLLPGDPLRAKYIAENFLEEAKEICNLRNMLGYTGKYKGIEITVMGSGMGCPSMGIYSWELFHNFNVEKVIRIGTCGVVNPEVQIPELILATSAYSESNFAYTFNNFEGHITYPSTSLNNAIITSAKEIGVPLHIGNITTLDVFGPFVDHDRILNRLPKELNILGEEMEAFALFHVARHFKQEASCILSAVDSPFCDFVLSGEERQTGLNKMIKVALEAIIK